ncbi:hypothetical protein HHO41_02465 [Bacillus sp. DNRA2]|uniref:hypothetical protein n=1 Tax=Bacillus sp. DNRA2 TaxID=2723053 RepID=UPI00145E97B6|nr:hypothetical protein [Bacillus sp. DNRA2]NMD69137.1 hypothetical protein [Bacillus sp. DNRA2]
MKLNQKGSSLIQVLLVILVFSVLGLSLMGNVIGENKRTYATETNMQTRYLAESGLTYFENNMKSYFEQNKSRTINAVKFYEYLKDNAIGDFLDQDGFPVQPWSETTQKGITVKAEIVDKNDTEIPDNELNNHQIKDVKLKVTSTGKNKDSEATLISYYKFDVDIDEFTVDFPKFAGGMPLDFSNMDLVGLNLLNLVELDVLNFKESADKTYRIPYDQIFKLNALGPILQLNIGDGDRFHTMETNRVIATRTGTLLGADVLKGKKATLLTVDLLKYKDDKPTNVVIDGGFEGFKLLGIPIGSGYRDINFLKLGVMGNALIQQDKYEWDFNGKDRSDMRTFAFVEGLYVNKSLVIGDSKGGAGNLQLRGDIQVNEDLIVSKVNLTVGDLDEYEAKLKPEDYYLNQFVSGNATIKSNSCIKTKNYKYSYRLFSHGKITIENNPNCSVYGGLFYAQNGIDIKTNGKPITINGALLGDVTIDGVTLDQYSGNRLIYNHDPNLPYLYQIPLDTLKYKNLGRKFL